MAVTARARLAVADAPTPAVDAGAPPPGGLPTQGDGPRLVVVLLRGAMDGLAVAQPYAEPGWAELRGPLALPEPGRENGLLDLGGRFGLHPRLRGLHGLYAGGEALPVQAVAGPYRTRSHFDAQDLLESGAGSRLASGWLNRALSGWDGSGREGVGGAGRPAGAGAARPGLAVGPDMPLLLRGPTPVGVHAATRASRPEADLYARLMALNRDDPLLGPALEEGMRARLHAEGRLEEAVRRDNGFVRLATAAGRLLAAADGPRVAALELGGWDTHAGQLRRMEGPLGALDDGVLALRAALGGAWRRTAVLVMTEFGRTVRVNGNEGTDHGTGGLALLLGGAVHGGRVAGDWPGLAGDALLERRDLRPTTDLRSLAKALLRDHLGLPDAALAHAFPDSDEAAPATGLLRFP